MEFQKKINLKCSRLLKKIAEFWMYIFLFCFVLLNPVFKMHLLSVRHCGGSFIYSQVLLTHKSVEKC